MLRRIEGAQKAAPKKTAPEGAVSISCLSPAYGVQVATAPGVGGGANGSHFGNVVVVVALVVVVVAAVVVVVVGAAVVVVAAAVVVVAAAVVVVAAAVVVVAAAVVVVGAAVVVVVVVVVVAFKVDDVDDVVVVAANAMGVVPTVGGAEKSRRVVVPPRSANAA